MRGTDKVDDVLTSTPPPTLDRPDPSARGKPAPEMWVPPKPSLTFC